MASERFLSPRREREKKKPPRRAAFGIASMMSRTVVLPAPLHAKVEAVHAHVGVAELAGVGGVAGEVAAQFGSEAEFAAPPARVGLEARHAEGAVEANQARADIAHAGVALVLPGHARERMQAA